MTADSTSSNSTINNLKCNSILSDDDIKKNVLYKYENITNKVNTISEKKIPDLKENAKANIQTKEHNINVEKCPIICNKLQNAISLNDTISDKSNIMDKCNELNIINIPPNSIQHHIIDNTNTQIDTYRIINPHSYDVSKIGRVNALNNGSTTFPRVSNTLGPFIKNNFLPKIQFDVPYNKQVPDVCKEADIYIFDEDIVIKDKENNNITMKLNKSENNIYSSITQIKNCEFLNIESKLNEVILNYYS